MSLTFAFALFWVIWWTILFAFLPVGVRSQYEAGEVVPGSEGAAPRRPMLLKKALWTTLASIVIFGIIHLCMVERIVSLDAFPFGPRFQ